MTWGRLATRYNGRSPIETLALEFIQGLHAYLTPEQMSQVVERNRNETDPNMCHSHDFSDANMFLHEAFIAYGMDVAMRAAWNVTATCGTKLGIWPSRGFFESPTDAAPTRPEFARVATT